ncbi:hypothetical protein NUW54_g3784 [Trametes sanguinea]|uniref:Uncharacterized protein n=1 Tax=Trametes sanguinea TaxID=158606 RepID=A0ACC1Q3B9_9APHY|nr:hypothetical protein NUW54_g3784 [Trametes sanguinea]
MDPDPIDKPDTRRPLIVLRTRLPPISFSTSHHSLNFQLSLFSPANPTTKPLNMATLDTQSLESFSERSQSSRSASAAGSLPPSLQQTMGLTIEGPVDDRNLRKRQDDQGKRRQT